MEGYCIALVKLRRKAIPRSFCDNIINHETKEFLLKYLFHAHYIMSDILIQVNESIAKFFTLMVECHLNKVMEFKCNTCIILGYLHSPCNLEGYCIALPKLKRNTILAPYCDNILNHDTNEGIVKLVTLMVKSNENITKMRVLKLNSKLCWGKLYTINVTNIAIPSFTYTNNFALVH